jgi:hypothetical protein
MSEEGSPTKPAVDLQDEPDEDGSVDGIKPAQDDTKNRLMKEPTPPGGIPKKLLSELKQLDKGLLREVGEYGVELAEYRRQLEQRENEIDRPRPDHIPKKAFIVTKKIRDIEYLYWQWHDDDEKRVKSEYIERVDSSSDAEKDHSPNTEDTEPDTDDDFEERETPTKVANTDNTDEESSSSGETSDEGSPSEEDENSQTEQTPNIPSPDQIN